MNRVSLVQLILLVVGLYVSHIQAAYKPYSEQDDVISQQVKTNTDVTNLLS